MCTYHGWTYDSAGKLAGVPNLEDAYYNKLSLADNGLVQVAQVDSYQGLIKSYTKPFTDDNHDALNENDYIMVRYNGDQIEPITG